MKFDFLDGLTLGTAQTSGPMTVVPLLGEDASNDLASFDDLTFKNVRTYGSMVFENTSDKPFILPAGYAIMTKQLAQDHASVYATLLLAGMTSEVNIACCIQQTQCGYIDGKGIKHFNFIPIEIRKNSILQHTKQINSLNFSRLWPIISEFQKKLVKEREGNLILFFNKYMDKLLTFNAEFECVAGQRGAIILVDNEIVGIEIAPTQDYWKKIWNPLIRDSYGSTILKKTLLDPVTSFKENNPVSIFEDCKTAEEMLSAITSKTFSNKVNALDKLEKFNQDNDFVAFDNASNSIDIAPLKDLEHIIAKSESSAVIDVYKKGKKIIYLSMIA